MTAPQLTNWWASTARAAVTLITCSGVFDRASGRYIERHVVRGELVAVVGAPDTADEDD